MNTFIQKFREAIFDHATILSVVGLFISFTAGAYGLGLQIGGNREDFLNDKVTELDDKLKSRDTSIEELKSEIELQKDSYSKIKNDRDSILSSLNQANLKVNSLTREINTLKTDASNFSRILGEEKEHGDIALKDEKEKYEKLNSGVQRTLDILKELGADSEKTTDIADSLVNQTTSLKQKLLTLRDSTTLPVTQSSSLRIIENIKANYNSMESLFLHASRDVMSLYFKDLPILNQNDMQLRRNKFGFGSKFNYKGATFDLLAEDGKLTFDPPDKAGIIDFDTPQIESIDGNNCVHRYILNEASIYTLTYCPSK